MKILPFEITGDWTDDLIWCPSQCELPIIFQREKSLIYLRWRWDDPWQLAIIKGEKEEYIEIYDFPFFDSDTDIDKLHEAAIDHAALFFQKGNQS